MDLKTAQILMRRFEEDRGWSKFAPSLLLLHLIEELSEIGEHILFREGYKVKGLGHGGSRDPLEVGREFAQAFSLFLQLANRFDVDLEDAFLKELEIMKHRFGEKEWSNYMGRRDERRGADRLVGV
ncbi:MAG: hypothetical protein QXJ75_06315 [Candidatus Bathyarchaeia archaeon]